MRMKSVLTIALVSMLPASFPALAGEACKCTKQCMEDCQKGKGTKCSCKACDCAKTKACGKECEHHGEKGGDGHAH